jgi:hypothetical protein
LQLLPVWFGCACRIEETDEITGYPLPDKIIKTLLAKN